MLISFARCASRDRRSSLLILFAVVPLIGFVGSKQAQRGVSSSEIDLWSDNFGVRLYAGCRQATREHAIRENYKKMGAVVQQVDGLVMVKQMAQDIEIMMKHKMQAITRIMDVAEQAALSHVYDPSIFVDYYNAKLINDYPISDEDYLGEFKNRHKELLLHPNRHFYNAPVNMSMSDIHLPTNIYDRAPEVLNDIYWSYILDNTFRRNYKEDPTLFWQFFCSANGFLRNYPAVKWKESSDHADLYDCRMRNWYIQASASPKDIVILLDISGSMTGQRNEIAKFVVFNILDTLSDNDFVNVLTFNEEAQEIVSCFKDHLVQANLENVRVLKSKLEDIQTKNIANFTDALIKGFEILTKYNRSGGGAQCNQALMLITDGAPYNYKEIFQFYNWPHFQVRVFTFLIGKETTDMREVNWMACANKGYYVHIDTLSEVKEKVQKYIPVMARPMVMYMNTHPIIWTSVYADLSEPSLTDWHWERNQQERQRRKSINFQRWRMASSGKNSPLIEDFMHRPETVQYVIDHGEWPPELQPLIPPLDDTFPSVAEFVDDTDDSDKHRYVITVATPVFDRKNYTVRQANLLGVAGTDIPIEEIQLLTPFYKLGVNGYSFVLNNNGYILYHPDHRPLFESILKPNYNSVDLTEVELVDNDEDARFNDTELLLMRRDMIDQMQGETRFNVKIHFDSMKRATTRRQKYFYHPINGTPFSLGIAVPDTYGLNKVHGQTEIHLSDENMQRNTLDVYNPVAILCMLKATVTSYFQGEDWTIHPDWVYCRYRYEEKHPFYSNREELLHFLTSTQKPGWKWYSTRVPPLPYDYCDKDLFQSLVFDAKATNVFSESETKHQFDGNFGDSLDAMYGVVRVFVATHSGLLRWQEYQSSSDNSTSREQKTWQQKNNRAIGQLWYRRAVDYNYNPKESESFVFSLPIPMKLSSDTLITATQAIFLEKNGYKTPVAVTGVQLRHSSFTELFWNVSGKTCLSEEIICYLLDDNGFILVSKNTEDTGKFFGEIDGTIMDSLVQDGIYKKIRVYDYQSVCFDEKESPGIASAILTPLRYVYYTVSWMLGRFVWLLIQIHLFEWIHPDFVSPVDYEESYSEEANYSFAKPFDDTEGSEHLWKKAYIKKTKMRTCDKQVDVYSLNNHRLVTSDNKNIVLKGKLTNCNVYGCERPFTVQKVLYTNLILLVVENKCSCDSKRLSLEPTEVNYDETVYCNRLRMNTYRKKPPVACLNYHPEEEQIKECGGCWSLKCFVRLLVIMVPVPHLFS